MYRYTGFSRAFPSLYAILPVVVCLLLPLGSTFKKPFPLAAAGYAALGGLQLGTLINAAAHERMGNDFGLPDKIHRQSSNPHTKRGPTTGPSCFVVRYEFFLLWKCISTPSRPATRQPMPAPTAPLTTSNSPAPARMTDAPQKNIVRVVSVPLPCFYT